MGKNSRLKKERKLARHSAELAARGDASTTQEQFAEGLQPRSQIKAEAGLLIVLHLVTIVGLCFALGIFPIESEDIFSNILMGQHLWSMHEAPIHDPFSFTGPFAWSLHRPLATLIFYAVHSVGELPAVQLFCVALVSTTYALLYTVWARRTKMPTLVFAVVAIAICASCFWFQTRIYVFACVYSVVLLLLITSPHSRRMLWAIPLQVLWINSHPSAALGIFFTTVWWFNAICKVRRFDRFPSLVLAGVVFANLISPLGIGSFVKFAEELFASHPSRAQIYEWFSPFHPMIRDQHLAQWFFASGIAFIGVLWLVLTRLSRVRVAPVLLPIASVFFVMSLGCARHIPFFYFALTSLAVAGIHAALSDGRHAYTAGARGGHRVLSLSPIIVSWAIIVWVSIYGYSNGEAKRTLALGIDTRKFPQRAIELVTRAKVGGNIFTEYSMGAYFLYRAYPEYRVYIDSARLDEVYGEEWFLHYMKIGNYPELLKKDIERFDMRTFILPLPATRADIVPIYTFLSTDSEWRLAYFDEGSMVYIKAQEASARRIQTYQKLNPLVDMGEVVRKDPTVIPMLAQDFALGASVNPTSAPFRTLQSWFQRVQRDGVAR